MAVFVFVIGPIVVGPSIHEFIHFSFVLVSSKGSFFSGCRPAWLRMFARLPVGRSSEFCSYPYGVCEGAGQTSF